MIPSTEYENNPLKFIFRKSWFLHSPFNKNGVKFDGLYLFLTSTKSSIKCLTLRLYVEKSKFNNGLIIIPLFS